ncbi:MAG TPA: class A beta-lactamase-related serine hydrolase, partial [Nannocystis exedens]|nr:class A beta-lactamase-related serine hydrolase [Nannocystis exedens]
TETLLARFSSAPLEFEPGTEFDPSNSGYAVLGAVIEAVTGMSYGEFVEREIFAPLGMERSSIGEPPEGTRQASGYLFSEEEQLLPFDRANFDLRAFGAAGNIVSTADDLSRFARALFEGRLLKDETLETMLAPANKDGYALGWIREREFGQDVVGHPGGSEGINAAIRYYRGDHTLIIAIANNDVIDCRSVAEQLGQITHGRSPMRPMERHEVAVDPARFKVYSGRYVLTQESRAELNRFFDPAEVERLAEAHVGPDRSKQRLYFFVPGHGSKVMHGLDRDTFFFKDAAATVATFDFRQRVGAGAGGGGIPEDAGVPKDPPASALHLRQGPLEIHFVRAPEHPSEPAP